MVDNNKILNSVCAFIEDIRKEQVTLIISEEFQEEKKLPFNVDE